MNRIHSKLISPLVSAAFALVMVASPFTQAVAADGNADEIMAMAKAQWTAQDAMKPAPEAFANVADDYTEFNADLPTRLDGKAMAEKFYEASNQSGDKGLVSEMQNAKVQFYGDTAILTYNYAGMTKSHDGKVKPSVAKSTRVYAKQNGKWMLVHANFAPIAAAPAN